MFSVSTPLIMRFQTLYEISFKKFLKTLNVISYSMEMETFLMEAETLNLGVSAIYLMVWIHK